MAHATKCGLAKARHYIYLVLLTATLSGCATSSAIKAGQNAEQLQEYDRAIVEYTKVLRSHPDNLTARRSLERAKLRSSLDHLTRGRRLVNGGRLDEGVVELQLASELNPASEDIEEALRSVRTQ